MEDIKIETIKMASYVIKGKATNKALKSQMKKQDIDVKDHDCDK